ncbi:hypothetical protein DID88_000402 [Monilinia fructigena]|uniref:Flavin reductase like domain-containing protein n=1 Tax=Monilinia fructigena TaxID=38457 RepID=A0A395IK83_9HELO|nr:hypothetical protein DID88_000402 [Monilinia fructigena]
MHSSALEKKQQLVSSSSFNSQQRYQVDNYTTDSPSKVSDELRKLQLLSNEVRKVMRHVPHAVVVLTTPYLYSDNPIHDPARKPLQAAGMTLSSFTTLTLSPDPIITFNIKRPSRTLDALKATQHPDTIALVPSEKERRFHIHILQCNPEGAKIANHFSRGGPISSDDLALLSTRPEKFTKSGKLAQGIRRVFECEILQDGKGGFIDVGDHTLVFGKVRKIHEKNESKRMKETEWKGLCYMQGKYHTPIVMTTPDKNKAASSQENEVGDEEKELGVEE